MTPDGDVRVLRGPPGTSTQTQVSEWTGRENEVLRGLQADRQAGNKPGPWLHRAGTSARGWTYVIDPISGEPVRGQKALITNIGADYLALKLAGQIIKVE